MPPKKSGPGKKSSVPEVSSQQKTILSSLFKSIESRDSSYQECSLCHQKIKSCLYNDHLNTKCPNRVFLSDKKESINDDIIFLSSTKTNGNNNKLLADNLNKIQKELSNSKEKQEPNKFSDELDREKPAKQIKLDIEIKHELTAEYKKEILNVEEDKQPRLDSIKCEIVIEDDEKIKFFEDLKQSIEKTCTESLNLINEEKSLSDDDHLINSYIDLNKETIFTPTKQVPLESLHSPKELDNSQTKREFNHENDYYLTNFENAIKSVLNETAYSCLLNEYDIQTINKFSRLETKTRILYVRIFQRKLKWISSSKINYDRIAADLSPHLTELLNASFLVDENDIDTYEEVMYLLQLSQLRDLAKECNVSNSSRSVKLKSEFIRLILDHFSKQKSLKFHLKDKEITNSQNCLKVNSNKSHFMSRCKKVLGKCYKLEKERRSVFVRVLMLYALSATHTFDPSKNTDSGQETLLQVLLVNMRDTKFVDYEVRITIKIFTDRDALLRYQSSLEFESELSNLIESKEYEQAFEMFNKRVYDFQKIILDPDLNKADLKLPQHLRRFTSGSIYCKILSIFSTDILERLKKYEQANEIYEFLLNRQNTYFQYRRARWFLRMALNLEHHLKKPIEAFQVLIQALSDKQYVCKAGRLSLYTRLVKMSETKRYMKIKEIKDSIKTAIVREHFSVKNAPTREIEGTLLHSEYIPGRKNVFIQNFEAANTEQAIESTQDETLFKNSYGLSVEKVALTHYIQNLGFTNGKHAETKVLTTLFGLLFWDIIFEKNVDNVFIDKFQSSPLDLQSDMFYQNRKERIEAKLEMLMNSPIDFICELFRESWQTNMNTECYLVSWSLFETVDELLGLIKCFHSNQLASLCRNFACSFRYFRSGGPDLVLWSTEANRCMFVEVKGPGDRLSEKQIVWLDFLAENSIECEVCYVKGKNSKRLR